MGYRLVQAVLVVTSAGSATCTAASGSTTPASSSSRSRRSLLSFDPFHGAHGALWLIGWRVLQALGGSMLRANSAAILTDAFPAEQRGFALGINQVAGLAGMFVGLVAGGLLAAIDWRRSSGSMSRSGSSARSGPTASCGAGERHAGRIDWGGNITFALGLGAVLVAHHLRHPALPRPHDGLDEPARARRCSVGGVAAARRVRRHRDGSPSRCSTRRCSAPRLHRRQRRGLRGRDSPAAACSSC